MEIFWKFVIVIPRSTYEREREREREFWFATRLVIGTGFPIELFHNSNVCAALFPITQKFEINQRVGWFTASIKHTASENHVVNFNRAHSMTSVLPSLQQINITRQITRTQWISIEDFLKQTHFRIVYIFYLYIFYLYKMLLET